MTADHKGSVNPDVPRGTPVDPHSYPCGLPAVSFALNDIGYQQQLLSNPYNFASATLYEHFEILNDGAGHWSERESEKDTPRDLLPLSLIMSKATTVIVTRLRPAEGATFGCQASLSKRDSEDLLRSYKVRPEFLPLLLGQFGGNHLPPGYFETRDEVGVLQNIDFICQQPRWGFRVRQWPLSIWIGYSLKDCLTTCIISCGEDDIRLAAIKSRLASAFKHNTAGSQLQRVNSRDPFLIPNMISHECFMQSDSTVFDLGQRLYSSLNAVDETAAKSCDREALQSLTSTLHQISQDAESLIQATHIARSIMDSMSAAQEILIATPTPPSRDALQLSITTTRHLRSAIDARLRWLHAAKARKDTTMALVYNIVSQSAAQTSLAIARDTKRDSSSMKAIAALTMVFLPATAVTSFFGMSFFDSSSGSWQVSGEWWIFLAVTVPLTIATVVVWLVWDVVGVNADVNTKLVVVAGHGLRRMRGIMWPWGWRSGSVGVSTKEVV